MNVNSEFSLSDPGDDRCNDADDSLCSWRDASFYLAGFKRVAEVVTVTAFVSDRDFGIRLKSRMRSMNFGGNSPSQHVSDEVDYSADCAPSIDTRSAMGSREVRSKELKRVAFNRIHCACATFPRCGLQTH